MPVAEATVAAGYAEALVGYAVSRGAQRETLLDEAGIEPSALADRDGRLPLRRFVELIRAARVATRDPALALRFGSEVAMAESSVAGLIGRFAETLEEAVELLNRYGRLMVDVEHAGTERFQLMPDAAGHWLVDRRQDPADLPELTEVTFARLVAVGRELFPDSDYLKEVHFAHSAPEHAASYEEILGARVFFGGGVDKLRFDPAALERRRTAEQPRYALSILRGHADGLLARLAGRANLRGQVEDVLSAALPERAYGLDQVAQRLALSRRTLHRGLRAEGTTFEQVLDELRRKLAADHLAAGLSVKQTAHRLGFSDPATFSRAFKRWTGASPAGSRRPLG